MKIQFGVRDEETKEQNDYNDRLFLFLNGKKVIDIDCHLYDYAHDGVYLSDQLSSLLKLPALLKAVYEAGRRGEELDIELVEVNEEKYYERNLTITPVKELDWYKKVDKEL